MANNRFITHESGDYENRKIVFRMIITGLLVLLVIFFAAISCSSCGGNDVVRDRGREKLKNIESYPYIIETQLPDGWAPDDLTALLGVPNGDNVLLRSEAARAYVRMHEAMLEQGLSIIPLEGYRSEASQTDLYNSYIDMYMNDGMSYFDAQSELYGLLSPGGQDEHQLGLTIDLTTDGTLQDDFSSTEQGLWVRRHAYKYGFILRYPADKSKVTGVQGRAWEFRYVGVEAATYITKNSLCLEEYIACCRSDCPDSVMQQP